MKLCGIIRSVLAGRIYQGNKTTRLRLCKHHLLCWGWKDCQGTKQKAKHGVEAEQCDGRKQVNGGWGGRKFLELAAYANLPPLNFLPSLSH